MSAVLEKRFMPDLPVCFGLVWRQGRLARCLWQSVRSDGDCEIEQLAYRVYICSQS